MAITTIENGEPRADDGLQRDFENPITGITGCCARGDGGALALVAVFVGADIGR